MFRFEAGHGRGAGHAVRCLALADELAARGWICKFATHRVSLGILASFADLHHEALPLSDARFENEAEALRALLPGGCDLLVVDHYGIGDEDERRFRGWARCVLVIDDLANRRHDLQPL